MNNRFHIEPKNWFTTQLPQPNRPRKIKTRSKMEEWLGDYTAPYYSPLMPIFSTELKDLDILSDLEVVTLRDGIVPLLWFFRQHPEPQKFNNHFLVHASLCQFVPQKWQHCIYYYDLESNAPQAVPNSKILLTGHFPDQYCAPSHIEKQLNSLAAIIEKYKLNRDQIDLCLPILHDPFYIDIQGGENIFFFSQKALSLFKSFGKIWTTRELYSNNNLDNYAIFDINTQSIFCDSSIVYYAARRGAFILNSPLDMKASHQIALSPYHHLNIYKQLQTNNNIGDKIIEDFNQFYTIDHDSNKIDTPYDKRMPTPLHLPFPNIFFKFVVSRFQR